MVFLFFVKVRIPSDLEIRAIGNFSLIGTSRVPSDWRKNSRDGKHTKRACQGITGFSVL